MNGKDQYEAQKISHAEKSQAESFYRVLDNKDFTIPEIGNILNHMGFMLVAHAEMVTENDKVRVTMQ